MAANDSVNGAAATLGGAGNATVAQSGTWPAGIALNTTTGAITTTAAVAPGTYSVVYQLCDKNTPPDCATATDTVTVTGNIVPTPDTGTSRRERRAPIPNVAANDTVNGAAATLGGAGNATVAQIGHLARRHRAQHDDRRDHHHRRGSAGHLHVVYQLCDKNTPPDCATQPTPSRSPQRSCP